MAAYLSQHIEIQFAYLAVLFENGDKLHRRNYPAVMEPAAERLCAAYLACEDIHLWLIENVEFFVFQSLREHILYASGAFSVGHEHIREEYDIALNAVSCYLIGVHYLAHDIVGDSYRIAVGNYENSCIA